MRVYKYVLSVADRQTVMIPMGAQLLDVQMQKGFICLWALCNEDVDHEPRHIAIYATGNQIPSSPGEYIATFQMLDGDLVFHAFEVQQ